MESSQDKLLSFEEAYGRLDEIVRELESGQNGLEASLKLYQEGKRWSDYCHKLLEQSEIVLKNIQESEL